MAPAVAASTMPSLLWAARVASERQAAIASSKLPTTAKASAVARAGTWSIQRQPWAAACCTALLGASCRRGCQRLASDSAMR